MNSFRRPVLAVMIATSALAAQAQTALADSAATSVDALGWMQGFPPPPDKLVTATNALTFPRLRWTFSHVRELWPTSTVARGGASPSVLPVETRNIDAITFKPLAKGEGNGAGNEDRGETLTFADMLTRTFTDGILVMHRGKVVYEKYAGALTPDRQHQANSLTKSFVGTLAAMLVAEGQLDDKAPVTQYLPELKDSAYGDATVRQVMDMTVGVHYSENYADPKAEIWDYVRAAGVLPRPPGYTGPKNIDEFLVSLKKEGAHGQAFAYKTCNAEVLAWIIRRVSHQSLSALLSEKIWRHLGAEQDAYFIVDPTGTEMGGGGLNTTLRDLARFGELMRLEGRAGELQIIPKAVVDDIRHHGDTTQFAKDGDYPLLGGWAYRDMWWVANNADGAYMARGIYGQNIYVDPKAEMVIVRYAAYPVAANGANDPLTLPAYQAVADALMKPIKP